MKARAPRPRTPPREGKNVGMWLSANAYSGLEAFARRRRCTLRQAVEEVFGARPEVHAAMLEHRFSYEEAVDFVNRSASWRK